MATTRLWLNLSYGLNGEKSRVRIMSFGLFKHCPTCMGKTSHGWLPIFCVAYSQCVPIFDEVPSPSG